MDEPPGRGRIIAGAGWRRLATLARMAAADPPTSPIPTEAPARPSPGPGGRPTSIVIVNTGDGKGKSSAAFGVMVRGWARGWRVGVVQCIKSGDWNTGEQKAADAARHRVERHG